MSSEYSESISCSGNVIREERVGDVAIVLLDRPEHLNALSDELMIELVRVFDDLHNDAEVRAVVLSAIGESAFCVGRDLKQSGSMIVKGFSRQSSPMRGLFRNTCEAVLECGKPTIAGIFGHTLGGGAELALACDIRIAGDNLSMGFPEAIIGMGATFASVMLPRIVLSSVAYDLLYTGSRISADEALRCGLVNKVVHSADTQSEAVNYAKDIAQRAPLTLQRYKAMITRGGGLPVAAALRLEVGPNPYTSEDREEGLRAWSERRTPQWKGR